MLEPIQAWESGVRRLDATQLEVLRRSQLVRIEFHKPPDIWDLKANSRVGVVEGNGWSFHVKPRIPIPRLMFLLGYASDPDGWKEDLAGFKADELLPAVANGFSALATRAIDPTPVRGYTQIDDRSPSFRGRIRMEDQLARTVPYPFEISYDDHTIDIPENRVILAAAQRLLRFRSVPAVARKRLLRVKAVLDGVQAHLASSEPIAPTRLNEGYNSALKLASLILASRATSTEAGTTSSVSFVFDLNKVFEDFLSEALSHSIRRIGGEVRLQYRGRYLDTQQSIQLVPDIVWMEGGKPKAAIDAKFKAIKDGRFPNADAYQMLAYCTGLSVKTAFLIYAKDHTEVDRDYDISGHPAAIHVRHLDLAAEPESLLAQVGEIADQIKSEIDSADKPSVQVSRL